MSIESVRKYFAQLGIEDRIMEFDTSSATVEQAAEALGTEPARICKTLAFYKPEGGCILVQAAGDGKVNSSKFKKHFGFKPKMMNAEDVLKYTGHAVGGVCAFAVDNEETDIYADVSMKRFDTVFPACGSSSRAIEMTCDELEKYSKAIRWVDVCKTPEEE